MIDWLNEFFSENLLSWNHDWDSVFDFLVINKRILDDLFSVNRSFNLLLSDDRSLDDSLFNNRLRNDFFVDYWLFDDSFKYFRLIYSFCGLGNGWFGVENISSILNSFQNLLFSLLISGFHIGGSNLALRILLYLFQ